MKLLLIFGTRPEAIKMAPIIKSFQQTADFKLEVCITAQHREMLDQVLDFFEIIPDYDLNLMKPNQTLFDVTANGLKALEAVLNKSNPDIIMVQGDTTSAFIGALAGYYKQIKVAHLEAGLRSGNNYSPFPEEVNRKLVGHIAQYHFAPTQNAIENLVKENISNQVVNVGNTVIDALFLGLDLIKKRGEEPFEQFFTSIDFTKRIILVTGHRRESFGEPFENICNAIKEIAETYNDVQIVYPVHLNPNVKDTVNRILSGLKNVVLIDPLSYPYLIWLMNKSYIVLTDSGGIQEEAPSLGKPVLVMREVTERMEGVEAGTAKLVGTNREIIVSALKSLLDSKEEYQKMANAVNPYGDGTSSKKIISFLKEIANKPRN